MKRRKTSKSSSNIVEVSIRVNKKSLVVAFKKTEKRTSHVGFSPEMLFDSIFFGDVLEARGEVKKLLLTEEDAERLAEVFRQRLEKLKNILSDYQLNVRREK
jgi:2,3-bisphosphoglycerate-independent phosphoglycerate mutase